jgi:tripeptidyl-peptidase-1
MLKKSRKAAIKPLFPSKYHSSLVSRTQGKSLDNMRSSLLLAAIAWSAACYAAPANSGHFVLHEKRTGAPHQWSKRSRAHPEEILPVRIGLTQSNLHKAEEYIYDVSDPISPNFGAYFQKQNLDCDSV